MKKIVIGSMNPIKLMAAQAALASLWPKAEYVQIEVDSSVSAQPMSDMETRTGAYARARASLEVSGADLGVGLEGGIVETDVGMLSSAWCCLVTTSGLASYGGGLHFHIPEKVAVEIRKGGELGPLMDRFEQRLEKEGKGKHNEGAVGVLTKGLVDRKMAYQRLVELAVVKLVSPEWYEKE